MSENQVIFGPFQLDRDNACVRRGESELRLAPKAFAVLDYLVHQQGRLVTKDELFQAVWPDTSVGDAALAFSIGEIRRALEDDAKAPQYIETMHRRGYRFIAEVHPVSHKQAARSWGKKRQALYRWPLAALVVAGVLVVGVLGWRYFSQPPVSPPSGMLSREVPALPFPDKPSIVVLPFTNLSGDSEQEYFSDGLTGTLISDLSKISSLFVIARNSAFTYKGKAVKVQDVGRELGVRYVLEGSVLKSNGQVRITAQLIEATTGYQLWSERYDRPLQDIFALQDEIVQKIVTTLKLQFTVQERGFPGVRKTTNRMEAYDTFLRGLGYASRISKETNAPAQQLFEHALELDPQYAVVYAALGWTYYWEAIFQWNPDPQNVERAGKLARQALALDDTLAVAHGLLSRVYWWKRQPDLALAAAQRALSLNPNNPETHIWLARALIGLDRPGEAVRLVEQAMRLNPYYPFWYSDDLGRAYNLVGRFEEAIAAHQQAILRNPNYLPSYLMLVVNYTAAWLSQRRRDPQTPEQALAAAQRAIALNDSSSEAHLVLGWASLLNKHYAQAQAEVEQSLALNPGIADAYAGASFVLNFMGRPEQAMRLGEQALQHNPRPPSWYFSLFGHAYYLLGRNKEAIEPLQRVLSVHPHRTPAHLFLAAAYSELGRVEEAQAEAAEVLRLNPQYSLEEMRQRWPYQNPKHLERLLTALGKAGLK